jgi:hypothetical protein
MKPEAARAPALQDDQLMSQGDKLEFQRRPAAKTEPEQRAGRMVIMPPVRRSSRKIPSFPDSSQL